MAMKNPKQSRWQPQLKRIGIISLLSLIVAFAFNEVTYRMQKDPYDRAPDTITLVIPEGTARRLADGEGVNLLPEEMVFVVGDVLQVNNQDVVPHQLGPIWVPPNATGSLKMEQAQKYSYACSFQSDRYLGLDVRPATGLSTRLIALFLTAPTLGILLYLYSLAAYPVQAKPAA